MPQRTKLVIPCRQYFQDEKKYKKDKVNTKQPTHHVYTSEVYINNKIIFKREAIKWGK